MPTFLVSSLPASVARCTRICSRSCTVVDVAQARGIEGEVVTDPSVPLQLLQRQSHARRRATDAIGCGHDRSVAVARPPRRAEKAQCSRWSWRERRHLVHQTSTSRRPSSLPALAAAPSVASGRRLRLRRLAD